MRKPADFTGNDRTKFNSVKGNGKEPLTRLRQQSWLAAVILFCPLLPALFLCLPALTNEPFALPVLLPAPAIAVYLQKQLFRHLTSNHRPSEADRLFPTLGAANWITIFRAGAVVALAGLLPFAVLHLTPGPQSRELPELHYLSWSAGMLYLGISLADLLDGLIARKQDRKTELGRHLDIETDAAGLLAASLLAIALGRLPGVYLLVGLAYYLFIFGIRQRQRRGLPVVALQSRPYARIIAGCQMGLVAMALLPIFQRPFTFLAAYIFMIPLLIGFVRDWLVVSRRIATDARQLTSLDFIGRSVVWKLPVALRLLLLAGGVVMLSASLMHQVQLFRQPAPLILFSCCLLAGAGFMGRSACLFLILLLASRQSPFGLSPGTLLVFGTAAALMLTGTGTMSLWAPEDRILYRRGKSTLTPTSEMP